MTIHFVDVSHYNGDYHPVGPTFAKATEGTAYTDPTYTTNKSRTLAGGWLFVGYHYLTTSSATAQAAHAYSVVGADVPLMVDVEKGSGSLANLLNFVTAYRALGGLVTLAYIPHWYWSGSWGSPSLQPVADAGLALISSQYTTYSDTGPGWDPYGGMTPAIWQYTSTPIDRDAFRGTLAELEDLCNGGSGLGDVGVGMTDVNVVSLSAAALTAIGHAVANADEVSVPKANPPDTFGIAHGISDAWSEAMNANDQAVANAAALDALSAKVDALSAAVAALTTAVGNLPGGTAPAGGSGTFTVTFDAGASGG